MLSILARGDRVIATARSLEKLESMISSANIQDRSRLRTLRLDITEGEEKIKVQIDQAAGFWGQIDVLVNNAGKQASISFHFMILTVECNGRIWSCWSHGRGGVSYSPS